MLTMILKNLYTDSQAIQGRPVQKSLKGGLRIMMLNDGRELVLVLSRDAQHPSELEWSTVLKHFPFPVQPDLKPERTMSNHRPSLRARLPLPKQVQLPLM